MSPEADHPHDHGHHAGRLGRRAVGGPRIRVEPEFGRRRLRRPRSAGRAPRVPGRRRARRPTSSTPTAPPACSIPLVAQKGEMGVAPSGLAVDKTQELSIVTVAAPGRPHRAAGVHLGGDDGPLGCRGSSCPRSRSAHGTGRRGRRQRAHRHRPRLGHRVRPAASGACGRSPSRRRGTRPSPRRRSSRPCRRAWQASSRCSISPCSRRPRRASAAARSSSSASSLMRGAGSAAARRRAVEAGSPLGRGRPHRDAGGLAHREARALPDSPASA